MSGEDPTQEATGYPLLAAELRRLRGSRSLREMEALSRKPPHSLLAEPVSSSALNALEHARQRPSVSTLLSLAVLYRCPARRLLLWIRLDPYRSRAPDVRGPSAAAGVIGESPDSEGYARAIPRALRERELARDGPERTTAELRLALALEGDGLPEEAAGLLGDLLGNPDLRPAQRLGTLRALARVHLRWGVLDTAEGVALRATALAEEVEDRAARIESLALLAEVLLRRLEGGAGRGVQDRAGKAIEEADSLATPREQRRWGAVISLLRGRLRLGQGREEEARALLERALSHLARDPDPARGARAAEAAIHLGWACWRCGDPPGARSAFREARRLARRAALPDLEREALEVLTSIDGAHGNVRMRDGASSGALRIFVSSMDPPAKLAQNGKTVSRDGAAVPSACRGESHCEIES